MAQPRDYYAILGIERNATDDQIRKAYRRLARQYHPDVNKSPDAAKRFAEVSEAYEVLSDAEKRREYDRFGRSPRSPHGGAGGWPPGAEWGAGPGGAQTYTWTSTGAGGDVGDFSDLFESAFGGFGRDPAGAAGPFRTRAEPRPSSAKHGGDIHQDVQVSFMTAALGGVEHMRIASGGGQMETIDVKIPPGIDSGAKLRLKGKGRPGRSGGAAGDLILTIKVGEHPWFRREGLDVLIDVPVTIVEAALGTTVTVPLLRPTEEGTAKGPVGGAVPTGTGGPARVAGPAIELKIPPGSSSGKKLRIRGKGIKSSRGGVAPGGDSSARCGDLYAVVKIVAPESLSGSGQALLRELESELQNPRKSPPWA
jgi:curved DNA-binding protein